MNSTSKRSGDIIIMPAKSPAGEKGTMKVTESVVTFRPVEPEDHSQRPHRNLNKAIWTIVCGVALPCIPIVVISSVLLYLIFHYRVIPNSGSPELRLNESKQSAHDVVSIITNFRKHGGTAAYYVRYNPSTLTTIAAWTGRIIPYLASSIMALVAFFSARQIVTKSRTGTGDDLLTPGQLTILIGLLAGNGFGPLKDTVMHRFEKKEKLVAPIPVAFTALALLTMLGLLIPIVDSWFGVTVTPVAIPLITYNDSLRHTFGRNIGSTSICQNSSAGTTVYDGGESWLPCNLVGTQSNQTTMTKPDEASKILLGLSGTNQVLNLTSLDSETVYYMADVRSNNKLDFKAQTYALSTTCTPMTRSCMRAWKGPGDWLSSTDTFSCSPGFTGSIRGIGMRDMVGNTHASVPVGSVGIGFSPDPQLSMMIGANDSWITTGGFGLFNPFHFGAWSYGYPAIDETNDAPLPILSDPDVGFEFGTLAAIWMLNCSATVYAMDYTWVNGSIGIHNLTEASPELGGMMTGPFAYGLTPALTALQSAANLAGFSNTSQDIAMTFAQQFSRAALAMAIGAVEPRQNDLEQIRNPLYNVTRVPLLPLYLLLAIKSLYVVAVIVLAVGAYCFTHPAETEVVKMYLSAKGLVASHFDQPDLIQQNAVKALQSQYSATPDDEAKQKTIALSNTTTSLSEKSQQSPQHTPESSQTQTSPTDARIGIMANADGVWQFVTVADGVWQSVKPIVEAFVLPEARSGALGEAGNIYAAWKR